MSEYMEALLSQLALKSDYLSREAHDALSEQVAQLAAKDAEIAELRRTVADAANTVTHQGEMIHRRDTEIEKLKSDKPFVLGYENGRQAGLDIHQYEIETANATIARLREALTKIACFGDYNADSRLRNTGSYSGFDEPCSVQIARAALKEDTNG